VIRGDAKAEEREELEATGDYIHDEKHKTVTLTESGIAKAEQMLARHLNGGHIYDLENAHIKHHVDQSLRAHVIFHRDVDYMVKDGEIVIVDEFTGRLMPGRRWSDGLHQSVEAKEKVKIERENQTLATVTFQNYFRKYAKLAGMTGTADTEAEEFAKIYKLDVVVVPPNRPLRRVENPDLVYRTEKEKWDAIVAEILEEHKKGRPVLVGTVSIEKSEKLSAHARPQRAEARDDDRRRRGQARGVEREVPRAGSGVRGPGRPQGPRSPSPRTWRPRHRHPARRQRRVHGAAAVLGGRGGECLPKGEERFVEDDDFVYFYHLDAFYRVPKADYARIYEHFKAQCDASTTRSSASTACTSLQRSATRRGASTTSCAGRAGRQGDPGASRFISRSKDDLMRVFGSDRISGLMQKLGMEEGVPIEHGMVTRAIERAQKQVEAQNFSVRKHLLEYERRDEQAAREHLRTAPGDPGRQDPDRRGRRRGLARVSHDARPGHPGRDRRALCRA